MAELPVKASEQSRLRVFLDSDVFYMFRKSPVAVVSTIVFATLVLAAVFCAVDRADKPF